MSHLVNPPPFLKIPPELLKDRVTKAYFEQQNTIIFQLWEKLGGNTDPLDDLTGYVEQIAINSATAVSPAQLFSHQVQIDDANDRIDTNEINIESNEIALSTVLRTADLVKVNQRVDELIDELVEQLSQLNSGSEAQRDLISLQAKSLKQIVLLNARIEEAFDTKIEEMDIE